MLSSQFLIVATSELIIYSVSIQLARLSILDRCYSFKTRQNLTREIIELSILDRCYISEVGSMRGLVDELSQFLIVATIQHRSFTPRNLE